MVFLKGIFSRFKKGDSHAVRLERARQLHGQVVKYVTERVNDNDDVVGRGGAMAVHNDTFILDTSGDRLFVCNIAELDVSYLMSGDGVIIRGPNQLQNGKERTLTVHFVYHRK